MHIATFPDKPARLVGVIAPRHQTAVIHQKLEAASEHGHRPDDLLAVLVQGDHLTQLDGLITLYAVVGREGVSRAVVRLLVGEAGDGRVAVPLPALAQLFIAGAAGVRLLLVWLRLDQNPLLMLLRLVNLLLELAVVAEGAPSEFVWPSQRRRRQTSQHYQLHV